MAKYIGIVGCIFGLAVAGVGLWWQIECDMGRAPCCIELGPMKCDPAKLVLRPRWER